jgi:ABC-type branched-subunit amino acid transport system ATPase component
VLLEGDDISALTPQDRFHRGLTLVPEGRELFVGLTVDENLQAGLRSGREWSEVSERISEVFPALDELRQRRVQNLSGGQQQMVAVGRGMAGRPRVLLLDEPHAGLAPRVIEAIERAVVELAEAGTHVLVVEEERTVDRTQPIIYMRRGRIEAPAEEQPAVAGSST